MNDLILKFLKEYECFIANDYVRPDYQTQLEKVADTNNVIEHHNQLKQLIQYIQENNKRNI